MPRKPTCVAARRLTCVASLTHFNKMLREALKARGCSNCKYGQFFLTTLECVPCLRDRPKNIMRIDEWKRPMWEHPDAT